MGQGGHHDNTDWLCRGCCVENSHRAGLGWRTTAAIQAFGDGRDSGGKPGVLSIFFTRDPSNVKFFINLISSEGEEENAG